MAYRFYLTRFCPAVGTHKAEVWREGTRQACYTAVENTPRIAQEKAIRWVAGLDPNMIEDGQEYAAQVMLIDAETGEILYDSETIQEG
jgi:hypothetical protein